MGDYWFGASGTEPLIRVMVEHHDLTMANRLAEELSNAIYATIRSLDPMSFHRSGWLKFEASRSERIVSRDA